MNPNTEYVPTWKQRTVNHSSQQKALIHYFAKTFNLDPFTIHLLFERSVRTEMQISQFLFPTAEQFHNPFLLNDMKQAIARIIKALNNHEPIVIFGDYDVDGMTSTALLGQALQFLGGDVEMHAPIRKEGYGLSVSFVEKVKARKENALIITVDNGSSSIKAAKRAIELGIDVIITDHHEVLRDHPPCIAFVNPKRSDSLYPFSGLSGAGVAFKVVHALFESLKRPWSIYMWHYIELACVGTVADMMPLYGENRVMVSLGLQKLNNQPSHFFNELAKRLYLSEITSADIGFRIAPILNSSGRIDDPNQPIRLLCSPQVRKEELDDLLAIDKRRKQKTEQQFQQIEQQVLLEGLHHHPIILVHGDYDEGIIGILAARITNKWHKPSIVIASNGKASCRGGANPHFSMIRTIEKSSMFLHAYGGHKQAAGFSIDCDQIGLFRQSVMEQAASITPYEIIQWYDAMIPINAFPYKLWDELSLLEPFGIGNSKPVFFSPNTKIDSVQYFGSQNQYFKCRTGPFESLSFQKADKMRQFEERQFVDFLYTMGSERQFLLEDLSIEETRNYLLHAM